MASDLKRMHRSTTEGLDDVIQLSELHEASLLHTLRVRYMQDKIYVRRPPAGACMRERTSVFED